MNNPAPTFVEDPPRQEEQDFSADALLLNLDGYAGPIDVLLELARDQKVDLTRISILQLARQFLSFIERAKELRLDIAAEYLVMAAWLAYLKSRLLLPRTQDNSDEPSADDMARALAFQLQRLEAMQKAAKELLARPQRDTDFFARGHVEPDDTRVETVWSASLYDLLKAYGDIRARAARGKDYELPIFHVMSMDDAMERMEKMLGKLPRHGPHTAWTLLTSFVPVDEKGPVPAVRQDETLYRRSSLASLLTASLELAKQGRVEMRQDGLFRPVYLRGTETKAELKETGT